MDIHTKDRTAARAERCLGRLTGLVNHLTFKQADRDMGNTLVADLVPTSVARTIPVDVDGEIDVTAGGQGTTTTEATISALGEFLERYSMYWPRKDVMTGSVAELSAAGRRHVDPIYLQIWDNDDLAAAGLQGFDEETRMRWTAGTDMRTGEKILLPVDLVCFDSRRDRDGWLPSTTSGNACGSSLAGAVVRGLYEQVERDAIMRTWYEQRIPPRLDISALEDLNRFRRQLAPGHYSIELLDLPTPTDCTVVGSVLTSDRNRRPKFLLYAGAHLTTAGAVRDALEETAEGFVRTMYRIAHDRMEGGREIDIEHVYDFVDNVEYYMRPENFHQVSHLLDGPVRVVSSADEVPPRSPEEDLRQTLAATTADDDTTPIAVDLTPADVRELGMYTVGVFVPELVEMSLPGAPPVNHPAMENIVTELGHPFP